MLNTPSRSNSAGYWSHPLSTPPRLTLPLQPSCPLLQLQLQTFTQLTHLQTPVASRANHEVELRRCNYCNRPIDAHASSLDALLPYSSLSSLSSGKYFHDSIHGQIFFETLLLRIIDTPSFQRLRDLKQLGTCYLVFPGASHSRFEHSLGVAHLSEKLVRHLQSLQPELQISDREVMLVKCAGLMHDLGHGPLSHMWDNEFIRRARPDLRWHHEQASIMMLKHVIEKDSVLSTAFTTSDIQVLCELIDPYSYPSHSNAKSFLYDVVCNARNSIDVDKFDYIQRDCHNIGFSSSLRHDRLIKSTRVIDNEITFNKKEIYNLYELFHTRYSLFKQVYSHRVSKSIEYMLSDCLLLADPILNLSAALDSPHTYLRLTDSILKEIELSPDERLKPAQQILHRIRVRDLYRLVEECVLPKNATLQRKVTIEDIIGCCLKEQKIDSVDQSLIQPTDIHVQNLRLNYAFENRNPIDSVKFFDKSDISTSFKITKEQISHLTPATFEERIVRVYLKHYTVDKLNLAKKATNAFLLKYGCVSPSPTYRERTLSQSPLQRSFSNLTQTSPIQRSMFPLQEEQRRSATKQFYNRAPSQNEFQLRLEQCQTHSEDISSSQQTPILQSFQTAAPAQQSNHGKPSQLSNPVSNQTVRPKRRRIAEQQN